MGQLLSRIKAYFSGRAPGWWFWNGLFVLVIVVFLVPPLRMKVQIWMNELMLGSPDLDSSSHVLTKDEWDLTVFDQNNVTHTLGQYKGDPIFINFWATWCPPCVAELGSIEALYKDFGNDVRFFLVTNQSTEIVEGFLSQRDMELPVYYLEHPGGGLFEIGSYPTTIIISRKGEVVVHERGAADWSSGNVEDLLKRLVQSNGK